jgi:hypothetical protein
MPLSAARGRSSHVFMVSRDSSLLRPLSASINLSWRFLCCHCVPRRQALGVVEILASPSLAPSVSAHDLPSYTRHIGRSYPRSVVGVAKEQSTHGPSTHKTLTSITCTILYQAPQASSPSGQNLLSLGPRRQWRTQESQMFIARDQVSRFFSPIDYGPDV